MQMTCLSPPKRKSDNLLILRNSKRKQNIESVEIGDTGSTIVSTIARTEPFDKVKISNANVNEANIVVTKEFGGNDSLAFMAHTDEYAKCATDNMMDQLDWFVSLKPVSQGRWNMMIAESRQL